MIAYCVLLFSVGAVFLMLGILIYRGKTSLIHDYHQTNIKEADKREYGRAFARPMFCTSLTLILSGGIALFGNSKPVLYVSLAVLLAGLIASLLWIGAVQKKYNGSIF